MLEVPAYVAAEAGRRCAGMKRLDSFKTKAEAIEYIKAEKGYNTAREAEKYLSERIPKESYYQERIISFLKNNYPQGVVWKEAAGPYSSQGIPDVTFILDGRYYGFEVKRPFFGVLSRIQEQTIKKLRAAGAVAEVVTFKEDVAKIIEEGQKWYEST